MQDDPEKLLGAWIQQQRKERSWTQEDLAERLASYKVKLHPTAITRIEQGKRGVRFNEVFALLSAFERTMGDLMAYYQTVAEFGAGVETQLERLAESPPTLRDTVEMAETIVGIAHRMIKEAIALHDGTPGDDLDLLVMAHTALNAAHETPTTSPGAVFDTSQSTPGSE